MAIHWRRGDKGAVGLKVEDVKNIFFGFLLFFCYFLFLIFLKKKLNKKLDSNNYYGLKLYSCCCDQLF